MEANKDVKLTGNTAMRAALLQLGFNDCYHMLSIMDENPKDADMWVEAFEAKFEGKGKPYGKEEWDKLLGHCMVCLRFVYLTFHAY